MRVIDADYLRKYFGMDRKGDCSKCRHNENDCGCDRITHLVNICSAIDVAPTIDAESMTYKWHDLRKDPNDLPTHDGLYAIAIDYNGPGVGFGQWETVFGYGSGWTALMPQVQAVVAWKEIKPFEGEE